jgi:electron transport complex protein RnfD
VNKLLTMTSSPHIRAKHSTRSIMLDVIIALVPALIMAVYYFGVSAAVLVGVSIVTCVLCEALYEKLLHKKNTIGDLSAVVTGILLAFNMPSGAPWWMAMLGGAFAILLAKMLYGGIGKNFVNPALAGRAFLMACWASPMTTFTLDGVTGPTPLSFLKTGALPEGTTMMDMFLGHIGGCLGEVSAIALLIGGAYLLAKKVISIRIPAAYIGTVAVFALIFPRAGGPLESLGFEILGGGLLLGALFMATDYTTSPVTPKGQILFGIGCGLLTVLIRRFGGYPEGVSYSILLMNLCVWLIDKYTTPTKFGAVAPKKTEEVAK